MVTKGQQRRLNKKPEWELIVHINLDAKLTEPGATEEEKKEVKSVISDIATNPYFSGSKQTRKYNLGRRSRAGKY